MPKRFLPILVALAAVVVTGVVHGFWTGRWEFSHGTVEAAARLDKVALDLPDWKGETVEPDGRQAQGMAGLLFRRYVHRTSGQMVTVFLVCGRPGPVSVHTPDACYGSSGFKVTMLGKQTAKPAGQDGVEFQAAQMVKKKVAELTQLRIFWAWNATGSWQVPANPRLTFARYPYLYKLYALREIARASEPLDDDACLELMKQLLPELQRSLFPGT